MTYTMEPIAGPIPRDLAIELRCDGLLCVSSLFGAATCRLIIKPGEDAHGIATRAGWSVTDRIRCPSCMRRPAIETAGGIG